jgi:LPS-assembly lipoprotein
MWWPKNALGRLLASAAALLFLGQIVAACGFTPVYHQNAQHQVRQSLPFIEVAPVDGKRGLQLRNFLDERIAAAGAATDAGPRYRLSVKLESSTEAVLIQLDNTATRQNLRMRAAFALIDRETGAELYSGRAVSVGSYNVVDSEFATIAAENNAAERVVREIGEEILDLLVVYFSRSGS